VLAVLAILAVLLVPSVVRETDQATLNQEMANLNSFSNALVQYILQSETIPATNGMASAIASNLPMPLVEITNNSRNFARSFLVDPNLLIGIPTGSSLPYIETNNAAIKQPSNVRVLIVSTLGTANPPNPTGSILSAATFSNIWNTPPYTIPADTTWSGWSNSGGNGRDVVIQRINLQPLFCQLILNNQDGTNLTGTTNAAFSITTTNTVLVPWYATNNAGWNSYYLANTVVGLCSNSGAKSVVLTRYVLTRNISFVFQNGAWNGQSEYVTINTNAPSTNASAAANFAIAATNFFVSAYNSFGADSGSGTGADQSTVLGAMANFMLDYTLYANETPPFSLPGSLTGMSQLVHGAASNVITYTGNGSNANSGILSNP
jgi:type II secretory pathway pseudopilin PulG